MTRYRTRPLTVGAHRWTGRNRSATAIALGDTYRDQPFPAVWRGRRSPSAADLRRGTGDLGWQALPSTPVWIVTDASTGVVVSLMAEDAFEAAFEAVERTPLELEGQQALFSV